LLQSNSIIQERTFQVVLDTGIKQTNVRKKFSPWLRPAKKETRQKLAVASPGEERKLDKNRRGFARRRKESTEIA